MFLLIFLSVTIPNEERKILPSSAVRTVQEDLRIASRGPNEINRSSSGPATHWLFGEVSTVPVSTKILTTQPTTLTKTAVTATPPQQQGQQLQQQRQRQQLQQQRQEQQLQHLVS